MRILDRVKGLFSSHAPRREPSNVENKRLLEGRNFIRARFENQFTTDDNRRLWSLSDNMSVDAAASWMVRRTLRMRCRQEYHNNSYFQGITETLGNYVIGTGPQLQMTGRNKVLNEKVIQLWVNWAREIGLASILKNLRMARVYNGEGFCVMQNNPNLDSPVKLDIKEIEADQVSSPMFGMYPAQYPDQFFDGVVLDEYGHPKQYHILRQHPGAFGAFIIMNYQYDVWSPNLVIHDYKRIRPFQQRGIPEALAALDVFAELRRYAKAVLAAAETAADYAAVAQSDAAAMGEDIQPEPMDSFDLERRQVTVLPAGWKLGQIQAEQPTTTYDQFETAKLREACRVLQLPLFFATLDARLANMSAAYVSIQPFIKSVQVDRAEYERRVLDRVLSEFLKEAQLVPGLLPSISGPGDFSHTWRWPHIAAHADPSKTAAAQDSRLKSGTTSIQHECAEDGRDWEQVQQENADSFGLTLDDYRKTLREFTFATRGNPVPEADGPDDAQPVPTNSDSTDEED